MKRLWWLLRVAGHDWMWEGGTRPDAARRLARCLPLHFSDPYALSKRKRGELLSRATWAPTNLTATSGGSHVTVRYTTGSK